MNLHNRLLQRVKKHTSMTVLFQGREPYPRQRRVQPAGSSVIQARLADIAPLTDEEKQAVPTLPVVKPIRVSPTTQVASSPTHPAKEQQTKPEAPSSVDSPAQPLQTVFRKHEADTEAKPAHVPATVPPKSEAVEPAAPPSVKRKEQPNLRDRVSQGMKRIFRKRQESAQANPVQVPEAFPFKTRSAELAVDHTENASEQPKLKDHIAQGMKKIFRKRQKSVEVNTSNAPASEAFSATEAAGLTPPGESAKTETSKPQDPEWQRLQAIFRKHQEKEEQDPAPPALEPSGKNPVRPVQQSVENGKNEPPSVSGRKVMKNPLSPLPSSQSGPFVKTNAAEEMPETLDRAPIADHSPQKSTPLQSVWNVQRLDIPESRTQPAMTPPEVHDESSILYEPDPETEPRVFGDEEESLTEMDPLPLTVPAVSSRAPVEVLPPSRPRPVRTSIAPTHTTLQRRPETKAAIPENQELSLVNTAIGPLPSDLWSLLGQKAPVHTNQTEIHGATSAGFNQDRTFPDQHLPATQERSIPVTPVPTVVQRQTLPHEASMAASPEQRQTAQNEKASQPEPNLDDLAQRVYSELRRRLTLEWERMRRK